LTLILYKKKKKLASFFERWDNAIHRINKYPVESAVCFLNTYPQESDLSAVFSVIQPSNNWGQVSIALTFTTIAKKMAEFHDSCLSGSGRT